MKTFKKKILPCLLAALMLIGAICAVSPTAFAAKAKNDNEVTLRSSVAAGGTVKLDADIVLSSILTVPSGVTVTLDLNGKTLSRNLGESIDNGGVIRVEANATLTITDGSGNNAGTITGGKSVNGGGICNHGTLYFEGGTVSGNEALNGGGIYSAGLNGSNPVLYLRGGVIVNNKASDCGGGVYNGPDCTLVIEQNTVVKKKGVGSVTYIYNVSVTNNSAVNLGGGIYNAGEMKISGAMEINGNESCDIYLTKNRPMLINGALENKNRISVKTEKDTNPVIAENFAANNTRKPTDVFRSADTSAVLVYSDEINGNLMLKSNNITVIQVYEDGKIVKVENIDSNDFVSIWDKAIGYAKENSYTWFGTADKSVVEITLGRDFSHDTAIYINPYRNIILDLNGHCVKRAFRKQENGYLFKVGEYAKFTVTDSNPNSDGYSDIKGGVIADGNGDECGGGVIVRKYAQFYMYGGTIFNCRTDYHGGGVYAGEDFALIYMQDCTVDSCSTKDSGDDCHGGGIYVKNASSVTLNNVTFKNCNSEDKGGALYLRERPRNVRLSKCVFDSNFANDGGGAIFIDDLKSDTEFSFEAEDCIFTKNKANDDGGAVYVYDDDEYKTRHPVIFRDCTFTENESTKYAGALEVDDNGVVIFGGVFTGNKAGGKGGAIYVEGEYDLSVAGKLIIKDNDGKDNYDNLCLEHNSDHKAYCYDAGLYEGSEIYVSTSNNKTGFAGPKNVSEFQAKYFKADKGSFAFKKTGENTAAMVTASLFGSGSLRAVAIISGIAVLAVVAAIVIKKKKGVAQDNDDDEE